MSAPPTWDQYMAPALTVLSDGEVHRARDICNAAADLLEVSAEERLQTIPSGQLRYQNRSLWALSYLARAGAAERPVRGQYRITDAGRQLLASHPDGITEKNLRAFVGDPDASHTYYALKALEGTTHDANGAGTTPEKTAELDPIEQIDLGIERIHATVAGDLLSRLHAGDPAFFEQAVLDLIMAMGYGGAEGTATRTQLSNDGGIDGIVDQDALGLSRIYVQAKRYALDASIGRPEIQAFVGALHGNQANQGVFITTARFSKGARDYADSVPTRVVLIDGTRLAALMIRYGVGVQVKQTVQIVEVDEDFFE
ncbi:restriction endonuclease [Dietzia aerolata]|uniref:Restriction endonuclease n=1 Tax=Dietzia aerolata TaxID=595984 RepID=A0ABV5JPA8_9ACTN|nr:restriction endonuclease [Dietzia aerolata]MBB0969118.1 restriction endonuclease [Dietzia aerolata]